MGDNREQFSRTELLLGKEKMQLLSEAKVAVFGVGGVGSFVTEALARCGVGHFTLVDKDTVSISNINRQLIALFSTVGRYKTEVMKERIHDINPDAIVEEHRCFYGKENEDLLDFSQYSYVIDAIDTISSKILLIEKVKQAGVPVISCMGAGNKVYPTSFEVADISKTSVCPLAKVMRKELKDRGIKGVKVVYSKELPLKPAAANEELAPGKHQVPGSISFVPSAAGLILAGEVIRDLTGM
ncbi:MAG: tRNA threonylcarbamoyladenosine dehydratase [Epulopiscium sp.]|nr:tRNA threonylcarbamoyladenosine dehydratase [Candidatus Epulonipiscium sp.]